MKPHREIREDLVERSERLGRRLGEIQRDLARARRVAGQGGDQAVAAPLGRIIEAAEHELGLIKSALARMDAREYGLCVACGGSIGLHRLRLLPYATRCEVCAPGLDMEVLREVRVQHLELREHLRAIEELLAAPIDVGGATVRASVLVLLEDLARELPRHFELEERGGYFADVAAVAPHLAGEAEELLAEHAALGRRSRSLLRLARAPTAEADHWSELGTAFEHFAARLLEHEAAENELVRRAFGEDA